MNDELKIRRFQFIVHRSSFIVKKLGIRVGAGYVKEGRKPAPS
jgi:hypothetical protein